MSSFPVPVSPSMRTVESVGATCSTCSRTNSRAALLPMIRSNLRSAWSPVGYVTVALSATKYLLPGTACDCYKPVGSHIQCSSHRFEQQSVIERFREELDCTLSHGLNPHLGISMSRDEDDRDIALFFFQLALQLQTRHLRHEDVSYQARDLTVQTGFEEFAS